MTNDQTRQAGRPPTSDGEDVRRRLIETGTELFSKQGFASTSIRELAKAAQVTPAMVHYYFNSKRGLYEAIITTTVGKVLERVKEAVQEGLPTEDRVTALVNVFATTVMDEPWLPSIVMREVLLNENKMRDVFVNQYASQMAVILPAVISEEVNQHHFREDLDPRLAFMSLLGLMAFPFMARPVFEGVFEFTYDEEFKNTIVQHTAKLFFGGVSKKEESDNV